MHSVSSGNASVVFCIFNLCGCAVWICCAFVFAACFSNAVHVLKSWCLLICSALSSKGHNGLHFKWHFKCFQISTDRSVHCYYSSKLRKKIKEIYGSFLALPYYLSEPLNLEGKWASKSLSHQSVVKIYCILQSILLFHCGPDGVFL